MVQCARASQITPEISSCFCDRVSCLTRISSLSASDRAIADFNDAIKLNPKLALAYYNRGFAYEKKGEYDRAIVDYDKAIAINPKFAAAYNNRGNAYYKKGDKEQAIVDFRKTLDIDPSSQHAKNNLQALGVTP